MVRTIPQIYDQIIAIKEGRSELNGLTPLNETSQAFLNDNASGSKVALWRLWCWIMATLTWTMEVLFDTHKTEVETLLAEKTFGTKRWYHASTLNYQHGYQLTWNGKQYVYSDTTSVDAINAKIVKRCSVVFVNNVLQFKVAKLVNDFPAPLSGSEKTSLTGYLNDIAYPGTELTVVSENPDDLRINLKVYFDPLVLNTDGSLISDSSKYPVKQAINDFIQNLPFDGRMNTQKLVDAIQKAEGVKDIELIGLDTRYGVLNYVPVGREYVPFAGHAVLNETDSTITYERYV